MSPGNNTQPIRGQYPGHVTILSQSEASIEVPRESTQPHLTHSGHREAHRGRSSNNVTQDDDNDVEANNGIPISADTIIIHTDSCSVIILCLQL